LFESLALFQKGEYAMNAQWLLYWWNLLFLLPFGLALLYLGLYTVSGISFGDGDVDADGDLDAGADLDADADADVDHDIDADHDLDADHDAGSDHDAESESDHAPGVWSHMAVMNWLGVGRVPVSIVLTVLLLTWGAVGFVTNAALEQRGARAALVSIPLAAVVSLIATHGMVLLVARYLPLYETTARRRHALLGSVGEAIFPIDQKFGMVSVRDDTGDLYQVACRAQSEPIPKGAMVQLITYNAKEEIFYVARKPVQSTAA
jgi:membrane protein implicated in regulation of membrane protease activity